MSSEFTPRGRLRHGEMEAIVKPERLASTWRKVVRRGMRKQDVLDLHDYQDFNRHAVARLQALSAAVLSSDYRPGRTQVVRLEKSHGICRKLIIPTPEDAVLFQALVDTIATPILDKEASKNVFFTRTHAHPPSPAQIDESFDYGWAAMWPEYQKRVLKFAESSEYTIITDLATYFDTIPLGQLRNTISGMGPFPEAVLDLLFYGLEEFARSSDYLPAAGVGLPQLNFEAPRLLAHAYLYEADAFLVDRVGDNFSRWMDDITIGVSSYTEGQRVLRDLDDLLQARGVRLNTGKTRILSAKQAAEHLYLEANRRVGILQGSVEYLKDFGGIFVEGLKRDVRAEFRIVWRSHRSGSWPKVIARLIPLLATLRDPYMCRQAPFLLKVLPALRLEIFKYYLALGYSGRRYRQIELYVLNDCVDDASLFAACKLLVDWDIHPRRHAAVVRLAGQVADRSPIGLVAALWIFAKYGSPAEVVGLVRRAEARWRANAFVARQVAAVLPRVRNSPDDSAWAESALRAMGQSDVHAILDNLEELRGSVSLNRADRLYLIPTGGQRPYPLPKVLFALELLQGALRPADQSQLADGIVALTSDRTHRRLLAQFVSRLPRRTRPRRVAADISIPVEEPQDGALVMDAPVLAASFEAAQET